MKWSLTFFSLVFAATLAQAKPIANPHNDLIDTDLDTTTVTDFAEGDFLETTPLEARGLIDDLDDNEGVDFLETTPLETRGLVDDLQGDDDEVDLVETASLDDDEPEAEPEARSLDERATKPKGIDVSAYQPSVNWKTAKANGVSFAYIKATEGIHYTNPKFSSQYTGATNAQIVRGGYHFARPDVSSGAAQAKYFLAHGGGWSKDGKTLPGALDIEYNPYGSTCYGKSAAAMVSWIKDFSNTYHSATKRYPVIYTTTDWWKSCTGNSAAFGSTNPLWIARYASSVGPLPAGWGFQTFWQYANKGNLGPGDQNEFNGDAAGLRRMVLG